ncbi:MAG: hypothetical protein ACK4ND_02450 [Cytophagaceae bacterium]
MNLFSKLFAFTLIIILIFSCSADDTTSEEKSINPVQELYTVNPEDSAEFWKNHFDDSHISHNIFHKDHPRTNEWWIRAIHNKLTQLEDYTLKEKHIHPMIFYYHHDKLILVEHDDGTKLSKYYFDKDFLKTPYFIHTKDLKEGLENRYYLKKEGIFRWINPLKQEEDTNSFYFLREELILKHKTEDIHTLIYNEDNFWTDYKKVTIDSFTIKAEAYAEKTDSMNLTKKTIFDSRVGPFHDLAYEGYYKDRLLLKHEIIKDSHAEGEESETKEYFRNDSLIFSLNIREISYHFGRKNDTEAYVTKTIKTRSYPYKHATYTIEERNIKYDFISQNKILEYTFFPKTSFK